MIRRASISHIMEDYLKAAYHLREVRGTVTTKELADELGVAPSTVTSMLKKLSDLGTVVHQPYGRISLTREGELVALEVIRHHRLLELFLREKLGYGLDRVHDEADRLEHVISEELEDRIAESLGDPSTDPHGSPIPSKDGSIAQSDSVPLSGLEAGRRTVIRQLSSRDPGELRYLEELGFLPGIHIQVIDRKPYGGPVSLRTDDGRIESIGRELERRIYVDAHPGEEKS